MSYCKTKNEIMPGFNVYPTVDGNGKNHLMLWITVSYHKLNTEQAQHLKKILEDWLDWQEASK